MVSKNISEIPEGQNIKDLIEECSDELGILQREAYQLGLPVIIIFEGWYDIFIGEIINRQLLPLDSRGFDFYYTNTPTHEESEKPFIARFYQKIPPKGKIAVFDRSWYMRGLIEHLLTDSEKFECCSLSEVDLEEILTKPIQEDVIYTKKFTALMKTINNFEKTLTDNGTFIIKIYFGAKKEKRLESRKMLENALAYNIDARSTEKIYKKDAVILKEMLKHTNTENAPWILYFIDTDVDFAAYHTMKIIIDRLKSATFNAKNKQVADASQNHGMPALIDHLKMVDLTKSFSEKKYEEELDKYQKKLALAHHSLYLNKIPMVLVFEGWDAAGKGGCIKRVVQSMNPRFYRVNPIGAPTEVDKKYHYLWRFIGGLPSCGTTAIYDRSWYGRVMVERVEHFTPENEWRRAYREINEFESELTDSGIIVIKFWLHISKEKQYERFTERSVNPLKQWKLTEEDWRNREKWDQYYDAVNEMIEETSTKDAPWVIVEADDKYYSRIKVLKTIIKRIEEEVEKKQKSADN